jgi:hypothetical protein
MAADTLYDEDFVVWTERQAEALRRAAKDGSNLPVDWENLAEEIESVGRSERRQVRSLAEQTIAHLLKLAHSPSVMTRVGWESEIGLYRSLLQAALKDSPSLNPDVPDIVAEALPRARRNAGRSLRRYGEVSAADMVEHDSTAISADQVLDDEFFLPAPPFGWNEIAERERPR